MNKQATPRLPRCVSKYDLVRYFDCTYEYLWENLITDELLAQLGYSYERDIKPRKRLGPFLTKALYLHFKITNLDRSMSDEIQEALRSA